MRRHIALHDGVARLRHRRRLCERPFRREADAEKADAELAADLLRLHKMLARLLVGLVQIGERRAGELELPARLEADDAAFRAIETPERDDVALLLDAVPAEAAVDALEQRADATLAVIRDGRVAAPVEAELLVLGADAPFGRSASTPSSR